MDRELESTITENPRRTLNDLKPGIDYGELRRLPRGFADCLRKLKFRQACEVLEETLKRAPPWTELTLPDPTFPGIASNPLTFTLPAFDLLNDDHRSWKRRADQAWREFRVKEYGEYLKRSTANWKIFTESAHKMRSGGPKRDDAMPEALRYELAARRYCLKESWASLQRRAGNYNKDRVRRMVTDLLNSLGLSALHKDPRAAAISDCRAECSERHSRHSERYSVRRVTQE
jgi:hypothetical protein